MNYLIQSLWYLSWPLLIATCYFVIRGILVNYEHKLEDEENG